jgi:anhydro-N-acetylmuramic acid kinase
MIYRVIGLMSGSSLDGLDIVFVELNENGDNWSFEIKASDCYEYNEEWIKKLKNAITLNAYDYLLLDAAYGKYIGEKVNEFIEKHELHYKVQLIASHGHTTFHAPHLGMTAQLGDGAAIAATTGINVVNNLRAIDVALGGQGAPIVPMGEKLLFKEYDLLLNIGGIANISINKNEYVAFDVCPANRVLNMLANDIGKSYDAGGAIASRGLVNEKLLNELNELDYYKQAYPKSLANDFGTNTIYPLIKSHSLSNEDSLRTYVEHIAIQIQQSLSPFTFHLSRLLITGGGVHNNFLIERIKYFLQKQNIETVIPSAEIINYKEALIMALLGVLRWREENTVLSSVTGASRNSIGGCVWIGQEA